MGIKNSTFCLFLKHASLVKKRTSMLWENASLFYNGLIRLLIKEKT